MPACLRCMTGRHDWVEEEIVVGAHQLFWVSGAYPSQAANVATNVGSWGL